MKISVKEVENLNNRLKEKISLYESKYLQYYNYINRAKMDWYDTNSKLFFDAIEDDKKKDYNTLQEMTNIYKIYTYISNNYKEIGNEIYYNPEFKEQIIELINSIINKCSIIISLYNDLGISQYSERSMLFHQKNIFINILEKSKIAKTKIIKTATKIEDIERITEEELSKITIEPIQEKDIAPYK